MTATDSDAMDVDKDAPNAAAADNTRDQRRGSATTGTGSAGMGGSVQRVNHTKVCSSSAAAPGLPPPLPSNLPQRVTSVMPPSATSVANPAAGGDPTSTPLPPSPAPTPASRSHTTYLNAAQEKAKLAAAHKSNPSSALNAPQPGGNNAAQVAAAQKTIPGGFSYADADGSTHPPPSYGEAGSAAATQMPQAVYQTNLASPGPGSFYVQTPAGFVPVQQPAPGIALYVMAPDGNYYPTQPAATAPIMYPSLPALTPTTAAAQGLMSTPAADPATATLRALINPNPNPETRGSPPTVRSPPPQARVDDDNALDYVNYKDPKSAPARTHGRPASISYDPNRATQQKATRQSSYPATKHLGDYPDADNDEDLRSSAAVAQKYVKRTKDLNSRMDEDDDDFDYLKSDQTLARRQDRDQFDEDEDEDSFDDLPEHPPGHHPPPRKLKSRPILFYEENEKYYEFTNFAPYPVIYKGKEYPTSEHLFQARKFLGHRPMLAEHIRRGSDRPRFAFNEARRFAPETRPDWKEKSIEIMEEILEAKFTQHPKLRQLLLGTGDRYLIENAGKYDDFWGNGADGNGRNELGLALMRLRSKLRERETSAVGPKGKGKGRR